jgi:hypothetical protein
LKTSIFFIGRYKDYNSINGHFSQLDLKSFNSDGNSLSGSRFSSQRDNGSIGVGTSAGDIKHPNKAANNFVNTANKHFNHRVIYFCHQCTNPANGGKDSTRSRECIVWDDISGKYSDGDLVDGDRDDEEAPLAFAGAKDQT